MSRYIPPSKYMYMKVTADELELPLGVWNKISEMAKDEGTSVALIKTQIQKGNSGKKRGFKYVKVERDSYWSGACGFDDSIMCDETCKYYDTCTRRRK